MPRRSSRDDEFRALAARLDDGVLQPMAAAKVLVEGVLRRAQDPRDAERLRSAVDAVRAGMVEVEQLKVDLGPDEAVDPRLEAAVHSAVNLIVGDARSDVSVEIDLTHEPPDEVRAAGLRMLVDALANLQRDADAEWVAVQVRGTEHDLTITVEDEGEGLLSDTGLGDTWSVHPAELGGTRLQASLPFSNEPA